MSVATVFLKLDMQISPQDLCYGLKKHSPLVFLDSSLPSNLSNFSYIGFTPSVLLESYGFRNRVCMQQKWRYDSYQHPLSFMQEHIDALCAKKDVLFYLADRWGIAPADKGNLPDFCGGFMGYLAYDLKNYIEKLPQRAKDDWGLPMIYLAFFDRVLAYDHHQQQWYYVRHFRQGHLPESLDQMHRQVQQEYRKVETHWSSAVDCRKAIIEKYARLCPELDRFQSNFGKQDYVGAVQKAKQYIHDGHIYQVNLSQRFEARLKVDPEDFYYILRNKNAAPYSAFIKTPLFSIASSSPERFLYRKGKKIQTRPIKGTRPRGKNHNQDLAYQRDLSQSIKDEAELNMIVDLERNDLGKFCDYGSVKVAEHRVIEKYARVMHSVSTVTGTIRDSVRFSDIIKATFPGGSITGAPKIRAMQIIDELEPTARNIYTGSIGYIAIDGTADFNIAIRTVMIKGDRYCYNVGGGIVADSDPLSEYKETLDKGRALKETINFFDVKNLQKQPL